MLSTCRSQVRGIPVCLLALGMRTEIRSIWKGRRGPLQKQEQEVRNTSSLPGTEFGKYGLKLIIIEKDEELLVT
jgi:hypothetical protein